MSATDSHPPERESLDPEVDAVDLCASLRGTASRGARRRCRGPGASPRCAQPGQREGRRWNVGHQRFDASARWPATAAAIASLARAKATKNASPSVWTSTTVVLLERCTKHALMLAEGVDVAAAQSRQQSRRALDIAEQERDGPTRKLRHETHLRSITAPCQGAPAA